MQYMIDKAKQQLIWEGLSTLLVEDECSDFQGNFLNCFYIPNRLFNGSRLKLLQKSRNIGRHWILTITNVNYSSSDDVYSLQRHYSTLELIDKNILSEELKTFIIRNIDLFENI